MFRRGFLQTGVPVPQMVEVSSKPMSPNPQGALPPAPTLREALTLAAIAGLPVLEARM